MKIVIIGDVHGRDNWQKIDVGGYDLVIFMGDYFDPYDGSIGHSRLWENFQKIVALKKASPEKIKLLFGNHDHHYTRDCCAGGSRQDSWFGKQYELGDRFKEMLEDGTLQLAYNVPGTDIVCLHAGLSIPWYNTVILHKDVEVASREPVTLIEPHKPEAAEALTGVLNSYGCGNTGDLSFNLRTYDNYGYDPRQGFLWWRCLNRYGSGLQEDSMLGGFTQVMGHTQIANLLDMKGKKRDVRGVFVDGLGSNWYTEVTVHEDGSYNFECKDII